MKIVDSLRNFKSDRKTVVTIGTFDGVHLGHQEIINHIVEEAKLNNLNSVVLTFFPHPRMVLQQNSDLKFITTNKEKAIIMERLGIDYLVVHPFSMEFSRLSAEEFVEDVLVKTLKTSKIIIGHDHRFGRNRTASVTDLIAFGEENDFTVSQIEAQEINDISISSTKIRKAILTGNVSLAKKYLGRYFSIEGQVVKGKQIGRTINFPTANVSIVEDYKLIPSNGVYFVSVIIKNRSFYGMCNIGKNPTINSAEESIEVHIFDFDEIIYDATIQVNFIQYLRDEQLFNSLDELKLQLEKDKLHCLQLINDEQNTN